MLRLTTFSTVDLADGGSEELRALLKQPKRLGLLVYLVVERPGSFHRRDSLLPLFWPELDQERARHALSQALHVLRSALGNGIILTRGDEEVGVEPEGFWCDATAFEALLDENKLEEGLALFRGDFLPGFHLGDAPAFMDWVEAWRARFNQMALDAAGGLCEGAEAKGQLREAVSWARKALEISPHNEARLRGLMRLLDRLGRRAEAISVFESFTAKLDREFELEPSPETRLLMEEIRNRRTGTATGGEEGRTTPVASPIGPGAPAATARDELEDPTAPSPSSSRSTFGRALVRTVAIIIAVLVVGVGGRYWYLSNRYFLKIGFQELTGVALPTFLDSNREPRVYLVQGVTARNWLDAQLGFPRVVREAEVKMSWLTPEAVPVLEVGLPVAREREEDGFLPLVFPERRVEWLIATGRTDEALAQTLEMFAEAGSTVSPGLDMLVAQYASLGVSDPTLLAAALPHGLRGYKAETQQRFESSEEAVTAVLRLLENFPVEEQQSALAPWLADPGRAGLDALWIATMLRLPVAREIAQERLRSSEFMARNFGFGALLSVGDCADLPDLADAIATEPGIVHNQIPEFVLFAVRCDAPARVLTALADIEDMQTRGDVALGLLALDSGRPLLAVERLLGPTPNLSFRSGASRYPDEWRKLRGLLGAPEADAVPILLPYLQNPDANIRALVASFLAHWGREEAVGPLLGSLADPSINSTVRRLVIDALQWFSGDPIVAAVDSILASDSLSFFHPYAYGALAWKDPAVAIPRLMKGLEDPRVREEASVVFLTLDPTETAPLLEAELDQLPMAFQIEFVEALQRLGDKQYPELLRAYMESGEKDTSVYPAATRALEHAYSHSPVSVALDALRSPVRGVRDIAVYGLSGHPNREEVLDSLLSIVADPNDERNARARLALWATRVAGRQHSLLDRGEEALARGDVPLAMTLFNRGGFRPLTGYLVRVPVTATHPHWLLRRVLARSQPSWNGWPGWRQRSL